MSKRLWRFLIGVTAEKKGKRFTDDGVDAKTLLMRFYAKTPD